jgi:hypothetical protein
MGYSARYHAASLAAVLLALAIGLLIGAGIGDDVLSNTSQSLERSLESDLSDARTREDELAAELERERTFGLRVYPALADERLRGETVGVVALGDLPEDLATEIEATVEPTGARLANVAIVREPPDLAAIAERVGGGFRELESDPGQVGRLGRIVGEQLVRGGGLVTRAREQLLERFSGRAGPVDNAIVVLQPQEEIPAGDRDIVDRYQAGLLDGIRAAGDPTVGVELRSTTPSSVPTFEAHDIPTSDSLELTSGKLAAIFALLGAKGNFGVKESADALLPEVVLPAGERRQKPSAAGGGSGGK